MSMKFICPLICVSNIHKSRHFYEIILEQKVKYDFGENITFIGEQPWRQKVIRFYDPDNHIIEVGESMEHLAYRLSTEGKEKSEISSIISMPIDFIKNSIKSLSADKAEFY